MSNEWSKEVLSRNLKKYMAISRRTQKEMAEIAGVSEAAFSDWVNGRKYPRIDKIQKMADALGILKSDLIEDKDPSKKEDFLAWIKTEATIEELSEVLAAISGRMTNK